MLLFFGVMAKVLDLGEVKRFERMARFGFFVVGLNRQEEFSVVLNDSGREMLAPNTRAKPFLL